MTSFLTIPHGRNAINSGKHCQAGFAYCCFLRSFHKFWVKSWPIIRAAVGEKKGAGPEMILPFFMATFWSVSLEAKNFEYCYISSVFGPSKRFRYDFHLLNWDASFLSVILNLLSNPLMNCCRCTLPLGIPLPWSFPRAFTRLVLTLAGGFFSLVPQPDKKRGYPGWPG